MPGYIKAVQEKNPQIKEWAIMGVRALSAPVNNSRGHPLTLAAQYCWGGKVISLVVSSPDNVFKAAVSCHPAMVDASEAEKIKIPGALDPETSAVAHTRVESRPAVTAFWTLRYVFPELIVGDQC